MKKHDEYRALFLTEALENHEELNLLLTRLEKQPTDVSAVHAIFRITHTLKGNAAGMGFTAIAELAHATESLFGEIRDQTIALTPPVFTSLFKAADTLGALIQSLQNDTKVSYKGIKTKLDILCRNARTEPASKPPEADHSTPPDYQEAPEEITPEEASSSPVIFSESIQVPVHKLDNLLNLVGELIIERDRIIATQAEVSHANEYARFKRISSDLQYSVMDVRLVQVGFLFNKFHRVIRDVATLEGKQVSLQLEGADTEIDRNVLQIISDSLIHLIRNAVAHGIERPEDRTAAAKPAEGVITLKASNQNDAVMIEIEDDGRGVDLDRVRQRAAQQHLLPPDQLSELSEEETIMLIFEPGFSTVEQVNEVSGRGVGMDVVKQALDSIGGTIAVRTTPGQGTRLRLSLPSSLAIKGTLLVEVAHTELAIPLTYTQAVITVSSSAIHTVGQGQVISYLGNTISIAFLKDIFADSDPLPNPDGRSTPPPPALAAEELLNVVVVSAGRYTVGLVVDQLLRQKEVVEKPLMKPVDDCSLVSGVTILGNGNICLVLHVPAIIDHVYHRKQQRTHELTV
ncbi:MAG: chemotaxis protein CheA [Tunicatimonas sp.]